MNMDVKCIVLLSLLLLLQLSRIFATEVLVHSKVCGADGLTYSNLSGDDTFYISGKHVDRVMFCKAIRYYYSVGCIFEEFLQRYKCDLDLSIGTSSFELSFKEGREMLQSEDKDESTANDSTQKNKPDDESSSLSPTKIAMIGSGVFVACCGLLCPCIWRKRKATAHTVLPKEPYSTDSAPSLEMNSASGKIPGSPLRIPPSPRFTMSPQLNRLGSLHLSMHQVARATKNFAPSLQVGEGGFGSVYKAHLENGQVVAIKRAKKEHFDGMQSEFISEVELLAKIDHWSLVKLLGYIDEGNERLLITEYVPNGTLREHLDGKRRRVLDFNQRLAIAIDIAHGLTYLHTYAEKQIIHRDVKASNILLTESLRAKVADFGFAKFGTDTDVTHIMTNIKGTVGYIDPEYMKTYQLTSKSDVYSFGVLLIEILTGRRPVEPRRPIEERVTLIWAFWKFNEGNVVQLMDPLMKQAVDVEVLGKIFGLAFQCAAPKRVDRPDMKSVGEQLWGIRADYLKSVKKL